MIESLVEWLMKIMAGISFVILVLAFFVGLPLFVYYLYAEWGVDHPSYVLRKDEFNCVDARPVKHYVMVGKVMTPVTDDMCFKYSRIEK